MAKEKAKHDGLLCFLLAVIVVLILVIGGGAYYFLVLDNGEEIAENTNSMQEGLNKINKINEAKEIVYTVEKEKYLEDLNKTITNKIPVVNLNTEKIIHLNKEIENNYDKPEYLDTQDYKYFVNDDILSLVIEKYSSFDDGLKRYDVYNVDITKGIIIDDRTLIYEVGETTESVIEEVKKNINERYEGHKKAILSNENMDSEFKKEQIDFVNGQNLRTISEAVNENNIQYFLDENGTLNYIIKMYNIAGGEYSYGVFKLEK